MLTINCSFAKSAMKACVLFCCFSKYCFENEQCDEYHNYSFTIQVKSLGDHEWNRTQQIGVLSSHPFESDTEMSDIDDDDRETIFSSMDLLSPSGHSDAQTLAMMLQEQLDAINKEIR